MTHVSSIVINDLENTSCFVFYKPGPQCPFPPIPTHTRSHHCPCPPNLLLPHFLGKNTGFLVEHSITRHNKTRQKPAYQCWDMQLSRSKASQDKIKESETALLSLLRVPQKHQAKNHNTYIEDYIYTYPFMLHDIHFSLCEPLWALLT